MSKSKTKTAAALTVLSLESIAKLPQIDRLRVVQVPLTEWGAGTVGYVRQLTADERDERFELLWVKRRERMKQQGMVGFRAFAVAASLCDADGKLVAQTPEQIDEVATTLSGRNGLPVSRLFDHVVNLNKLLKEDVEELEKN